VEFVKSLFFLFFSLPIIPTYCSASFKAYTIEVAGNGYYVVWTCTFHSVPSYPKTGEGGRSWASIRAAAPMIMAVQ
jgi:hypothetical protein